MKFNNFKNIALSTVVASVLVFNAGLANAQDDSVNNNTISGKQVTEALSGFFGKIKAAHQENAAKYEGKTEEEIREMNTQQAKETFEKLKVVGSKVVTEIKETSSVVAKEAQKGMEVTKKKVDEVGNDKSNTITLDGLKNMGSGIVDKIKQAHEENVKKQAAENPESSAQAQGEKNMDAIKGLLAKIRPKSSSENTNNSKPN